MEHADNPERLEPAGLSVAMDSVRTAVTHVIKLADDGGLNDFDTAGLVQLLRDFQGLLNLLPVFDQMLVQHCVEQRVAEDLCFRNLRAVMGVGAPVVNSGGWAAGQSGWPVRRPAHHAW